MPLDLSDERWALAAPELGSELPGWFAPDPESANVRELSVSQRGTAARR
jgi:hypothetical protein